jgi:hypothetical protein
MRSGASVPRRRESDKPRDGCPGVLHATIAPRLRRIVCAARSPMKGGQRWMDVTENRRQVIMSAPQVLFDGANETPR